LYKLIIVYLIISRIFDLSSRFYPSFIRHIESGGNVADIGV